MTLHRWLVVSVIISSSWAAAPGARAEGSTSASDVARAESYAADAFDAYTRKDYAASVALYLKALETAPTADMLYNLARIYDGNLKDRQLAIDYYRRYVRDPGADPARLRTSNERLSQLLELETINSETPPIQKRAELPANADDRATTPAVASGSGITGTQMLGILALTAGVSGLGIGVGFGVSAKSDSDVANKFCKGNACSSQQGVDASRDASRAATISTVGFIAGGVLSALGTVVLILGSSEKEPERSVASVSIAPLAGPHLVGTRISGQW